MSLSRRQILAGLLASVPAVADAAPLRPKLRPRGGVRSAVVSDAAPVVAQTGLGDLTGFSLRDLSTGRVLEEHRPDAALPPASVTKAITALYALEALGEAYKFRTVVAASGPVRDGRVQGDLYLIGGGDPHLDTDGLADLAKQVAAAGIFGVTGRAWVIGNALPYHRSIDPEQPEYVGYNPAISGLNLNFNRVHFEWKPSGGGFTLATTARSTRFDPAVRSVEVQVVEGGPVFAYQQASGRDLWSVNRAALGKGGARWLPVRTPDLYAGEVFRVVAGQYNLRLPDLARAERAPAGLTIVAQVESAPAGAMLRAMMKYSTNLTAEVAGLRAHQARGGLPSDIGASGAAMTDWARGRFGLGRAVFRNHSGLTDETRISAAEMVQLLDHAAGGALPALMKPVAVVDDAGRELQGVKAVAKTGTLNFTRGLAGYLDGANGRRMGFAIFASDLAARARANLSSEQPRGARTFRNRAQTQERALLRRWAQMYGVS